MERSGTTPSCIAGVACALVVWTGCYSYAPIDREALRPGLEVRTRVADTPGRTNSSTDARLRALDGEVTDWSDRSLVLSVWRTDLRAAARFEPRRQRVELPWDEIAGIRARQLSYPRTGALVGAIGAGAALIIQRFFSDSGANADRPDPSGDPT